MTVCSKVNFHYPLAECGCAYDVYLSLTVQHQRASYLAYIYHYIFYTPRMQKVKALCNQMAFAKRLHKSFTVIATVRQKKCKCLRLQLNLIPVIIKARHSICMKCFACLDGESTSPHNAMGPKRSCMYIRYFFPMSGSVLVCKNIAGLVQF